MFFEVTSLVYDKLITAVFRHEDFLNLGSHTRKKHMSLTKSRNVSFASQTVCTVCCRLYAQAHL